MKDLLRIATRRSALALWQARHVASLLEARYPGLSVELVPMLTRGDRILDRPLAEIGGKGLFLKELEQALLEHSADLAVHSMKDMPAGMTPGLLMPCALPRANPADALLIRDRTEAGASLTSLPAGSRVGTSSLRRQCQLLAARPDLRVLPLRGNVDTRLGKLQAGEFEAIILACAGLERLGLGAHVSAELAPPAWLPAATQGIIGLQCRDQDADTLALITPLDDADAADQARAERTVTRLLQGSCQVPLAAHARLEADAMDLEALIGMPDGQRILRARASGKREDAEALGEAVAHALLAQGAGEILAALDLSPGAGD